jgi:hypothetical protein
MLLFVCSAFASEMELQPYVLGQVWGTVYDQDVGDRADPAGYGDPEDDMGFKVRRARIGVNGSYGDQLTYGIDVGMSSGSDALSRGEEDVQLVGAWAGVQLTELVGMNVGLTKVPFGRENLMSSAEIPFQERTVQSNHMVSRREVGAVVDANGGMWRLRAGAFNGNGSLLGDTDPGGLAVARAEVVIGDGDVYRTYGTVEGLTLGVGGDFAFNDEFATRSMSYGGDLIVRTGGLTAMVEGHMARITPTDATVDAPGVFVETKRWGGYGQLGYSMGLFEPVLRVELFDEDMSVSDNGDLLHAVVGLNAHLMDDRLRVGGGYVHRAERGGLELPNSTARLWVQFRSF